MFSMTTEYALRAAVYLSEQREELQTAQQVADATHVPPRYATRVLQLLVESGLATSQRGPTGGFSLSRDPSDVTLLEVVLAVEPVERITSCPLNLPEHEHELCPLHKHMDQIALSVRESLGAVSLKDVMTSTIVPLGISIGGTDARSSASSFDARPRSER